jgi:hypothetical protein
MSDKELRGGFEIALARFGRPVQTSCMGSAPLGRPKQPLSVASSMQSEYRYTHRSASTATAIAGGAR